MDRGDLVPDEVIVGVIAERIDSSRGASTASSSTASRARPRRPRRSTPSSPSWAAALTAVLLIDVSDDEVVRRLGGRRTCVENGHVFHVEFDPPEAGGRLRHRRQPS